MRERFSRTAYAAFDRVFGVWEARRIAGIHLAGLPRALPGGLPLLVVGNHVSWWDAFALRELHRRLRPRAPLRTVMLEAELRRFPFFRRLGAIGIQPGSPASILRCLGALERSVREAPDTVLLFFPQGRIWPSYRRPLGFARGVETFARRLAPLIVLPVAQHLEPLNRAAPSIFVSAGAPLRVDDVAPGHRALEALVEAEADRILAFLGRHGERAAAEWPDAFAPLAASGGARPVPHGDADPDR